MSPAFFITPPLHDLKRYSSVHYWLYSLPVMEPESKSVVIRSPVFVVSLSTFLALCYMVLPNSPHPEYANFPLTIGGYTTAALFTTGLIGVFVTHPPKDILRRLFQNPILTFFGKYSYSMYLFHLSAALILLDIYWHSELRGWKPYFLYTITTYAATVLVALLTWNLLEKHILGLKKYFEYKNPQ
jgi:peptidoglycan/LPS O-acetylase OafA/YrhL